MMDNFELYYRLNKDGSSEKITGVPPLSFVSNGENLVDYKIYGASGGVGDRTANLYNESAAVDTNYFIKSDGSSAIGGLGDRFLQVRLDVTPSTYYVFSWLNVFLGSGNNSAYIRIAEYKANNQFILRTLCNCSAQTDNAFLFYTGNNTSYIDVRIDSETSSRGQHLSGIMIVSGNTAPTSYEPYGYKIPVVCGGTTTNIYLDEPLEENESISMSDTGVSIPTINGTTILSVDTAVQPSRINVALTSKQSKMTDSMLKYFSYKYGILKRAGLHI